MPEIKNKSIKKSDAAQCLINNGFYTESIHCIYYSSFLYMKYILHHIPSKKGGVPYGKQQIKGASSHEYVFKLIKERIGSPLRKKDLTETFRYLKDMRKGADYFAETFSAEDSCIAKEKAESLKRILKDAFGNL